jgi:hypothetical protein
MGASAWVLLWRIAWGAVVATATFISVLVFQFVIALALFGPDQLLAPAFGGLFGPALAYCLLRPIIVISLCVELVGGVGFFLGFPSYGVYVTSGEPATIQGGD